MLVLDTDLLTIIQRQEGAAYERLVARLKPLAEKEPVAITIVSLEEQMRGWLAFLNANPEKSQVPWLLVIVVSMPCFRTIN
ncbi:MAG TPA: hypothetical protein VFE62_13335 [Gemmataceae bacterium]|nr:hypothetical protein [Gemmataceae bacterium]